MGDHTLCKPSQDRKFGASTLFVSGRYFTGTNEPACKTGRGEGRKRKGRRTGSENLSCDVEFLGDVLFVIYLFVYIYFSIYLLEYS